VAIAVGIGIRIMISDSNDGTKEDFQIDRTQKLLGPEHSSEVLMFVARPTANLDRQKISRVQLHRNCAFRFIEIPRVNCGPPEMRDLQLALLSPDLREPS